MSGFRSMVARKTLKHPIAPQEFCAYVASDGLYSTCSQEQVCRQAHRSAQDTIIQVLRYCVWVLEGVGLVTHDVKFRGFARQGGFQKSGFGGCSLDPQKRNEGPNKKKNDGTKNRNEGTKKRNDGTKSRNDENHPFYKTALNCFPSHEVSDFVWLPPPPPNMETCEACEQTYHQMCPQFFKSSTKAWRGLTPSPNKVLFSTRVCRSIFLGPGGFQG